MFRKYNEITFYHDLHKHFPGRIVRVENMFDLGTPDTYFSTLYGCGWMELKCKRIERCRGEVKIPFRPGQYPWLRDHYQSGGLSILALWGDEGYYFFFNDAIQICYDTFTQVLSKGYFIKNIDLKTLTRMMEYVSREVLL